MNPAFGGDSQVTATSFYLYVLFPLLDPDFIAYYRYRVDRPAVFVLMAALAGTCAVDPGVAVRMVALAICISYLHYLWRRDEMHVLGGYTAFSALFAFIQFGLALAGSPAAEYLYPDRIGSLVWGESALLARAGFEDGYLFPVRVAGLSREPSFYNLQLLATLFAHAFVARIFSSPWGVAITVLAVLLSFSKITPLVVVGGIVVIASRRLLRHVPSVLIFLAWTATAVAATVFLYEARGGPFAIASGEIGETLLHRTVGYYLLPDLRVSEIFFGLGRGNVLGESGRFPFLSLVFGADKSAALVLAGSGAAQSIIEYGLVSTLVQVACASSFGIKSAGLLLYLIFGLTMNPLVVTSHGVIAGFVALSLRCSDPRTRWWSRRRRDT